MSHWLITVRQTNPIGHSFVSTQMIDVHPAAWLVSRRMYAIILAIELSPQDFVEYSKALEEYISP